MGPYLFVLGVLGVWRVTHLLHVEDGPWDAFARLRARARGPFWSGVLGCFYCLSMWVALPIALLGGGWREQVLAWPALSAGAIVIELLTTRSGTPPAAFYVEEDEENDDALLRQDSPAR